MKDVTAIIISFLRPEYTFECIKSLHEQYPSVKILVGDNADQGEDFKKQIEELGVRCISLPYDCGVGYARNRLIEQVNTEYILVGDNDFYYTDEAKVDKMLEFLEANKTVSLIGGRIRERGEVRNYQGHIDIYDDHFIYHKLKPEDFLKDQSSGFQYQKCDITFNFFVARREGILNIKWDENIKVAYEHSDWFISVKKAGVEVVFSPDPIVIHKPDHIKLKDITEYRKYRNRKEDKEYFFKKHNLRYSIGLNGSRTNTGLRLDDLAATKEAVRRHKEGIRGGNLSLLYKY